MPKRVEFATAITPSEVDDADVVAGYAMQRRAEQAAHYRIEKVAVKVVAGTPSAVTLVALDGEVTVYTIRPTDYAIGPLFNSRTLSPIKSL